MLTEHRISQRLQGMSALERKVYRAVPIGEAWRASQIAGELTRLSTPVAHHDVRGSLSHLVAAGLVREPAVGHFIRAEAKPPKPEPTKEADPMPTPAPVRPSAPDSQDIPARLGTVAASFRALADELDQIALACVERDETTAAQLQKYTQLRALLREGL